MVFGGIIILYERINGEVHPLTEKELRKLNRYQLLELLIAQTERADQLQAKLEATEQELSDQKLKISSLGSIAEASLQLNGVFQSAQNAADMYIDNAKKRAEMIVRAARRKAAKIIAQTHEQLDPTESE